MSHLSIRSWMGLAILMGLALLVTRMPVQADQNLSLQITEILASNDFGLEDEDGEHPDWIEIYNPTETSIQLEGWTLTDNAQNPTKWVFPARALGPHEYLVIFASGKDRRPTDADRPLHTNFKLSASGEYLALFAPDHPDHPVDGFTPQFPKQYTDISYGRWGEGYGYFAHPTPGEPNDEDSVYQGVVEPVEVSVPRGFFDAPFQVTLQTDTPEAIIRYTLNGDPPTESTGTIYTGPIPIYRTSTLRAAAFRSDFIPSPSITHTYIFPAQAAHQPANPTGFPAYWGWYQGQQTPADYEMDPDIVYHPDYRDEIVQDLQSLPVLSIVTKREDMFGKLGIYSYPLKHGRAWERPASIEWFSQDDPGFQLNAGVRIHGGNSRRPDLSAKHSFRLYFRGDYGPDELRYPLFPDTPVTSFKRLVVRANFTDSWLWGVANALLLRDQWARDTEQAMGKLNSHGIFVQLYVDGLYWGVYNLIERIDDHFAASYYPDAEQFDILKGDGALGVEIKEGDLEAWNAMMALADQGLEDPDAYLAIQQYLDIDTFIDYMIMNFYAGHHHEWPKQNWYAIRPRTDQGRFQFISWDSEAILNDVHENIIDIRTPNSPAWLYDRLRANPEFRLRFADHVQQHFFNQGALYVNPNAPQWDPDHPENNIPAARLMKRAQRLEQAIVGESARWGDWKGNKIFTRNQHWLPEVHRLIEQYFPQRSAIVLQQCRDAGLYPSLDAPTFNQHGGQVEDGFLLVMTAPQGDIYYTLDGQDPRVPIQGTPSPSAQAYDEPLVLHEGTITIKARVWDGSQWSALTQATFQVQSQERVPVVINELMYHPDADGDEFIELYNFSQQTVSLYDPASPSRTWSFIDGIDYQFPPQVSLPPGGFLLVVKIDPDLFRTKYHIPTSVPIFGPYDGKLSNGGERVALARPGSGNSTLLVDAVTYDDAPPWPTQPDGHGPSLERIDPLADSQDPSNWRASLSHGGSPGRANRSHPIFLPDIHSLP